MSLPQFARKYEPERIMDAEEMRNLLLSGKARFIVRLGDEEITYRVSRVKDTAEILLVSYLNIVNGVNTFNYAGRVRITRPVEEGDWSRFTFELTMRSMIAKRDEPYVLFTRVLDAVNANNLGTLEIHAA